jgi:hypothetical protein
MLLKHHFLVTDRCVLFLFHKGWWVTATTVVDDCAGSTYTQCTTKIKAVGSRSMAYMTMTMSASFVASVMCVGALALLFVRRRRVAAGKIDLAEEEEKAGHFEIMSDQFVQV